MEKKCEIPACGCVRKVLDCSPAAGCARGLRGLSGAGFAQLFSCFGGATCTQMQILVLLSAELCSAEKALPGSPPISSHLCFRVPAQFDGNVFGRNASLCNRCGFHPLLPFLSVMFAWSPCGTQPDGSCAFLLATDCTHTGVRCVLPECTALKALHCCCRGCETQPLSQLWKYNRAVEGGVNSVCEMTISRLLPAAHLSSLQADDNLCNCSLCPFCQE